MSTDSKPRITITVTIAAPADKVWQFWNAPEHITQWNNPSSEWYTPKAEADLRPGGRFSYRMEARDGSAGFDFFGTYDEVRPTQYIAYTLGDDRKADVTFAAGPGETVVTQTFEAENQNPEEMQRQGWQGILDSFKRYVEAN
jgi:uncharacterized protein YndB with AHSA1/START domain